MERSDAPRLLVVDDDADIVKLVSVAMRGRGYQVEGVGSLAEALLAIRETTFDVVLTDKNLRTATGLELIDAITLHSPSTAIVLMTAYPDGALGRLSSLDGYLSKPFRSLDVLAQTLRDALDRKQRTLTRQKLISQLGEVQSTLAPAAAVARSH